MKKLLSFAAAGAALLSVCAAPGVASAATITLVTSNGTNMSALQVGLQGIGGFVDGTTALSFSSDWVEFYVTPAGTNTTVTVDDLAGALYPGEQWEITGPGLSIGAESANDTPTPIAIPFSGIANDYYLRLASSAPTVTDGGSSNFSLTVPLGSGTQTPLPGALALFAGGLGLLGATALRRSKKVGRSLQGPALV